MHLVCLVHRDDMYQQVSVFSRSLRACWWNQLRSIAHADAKSLDGNHGQVHSREWANAKPSSEIPGPTPFQLVRAFLPGGIFYKKSPIDFVLLSRQKWGDLVKIPGIFGKESMLMSFNPDDFATVIRSEGIWPRRLIFETMHYHRKIHRADFFQGHIGLLNSNDEEWGRIRSTVNPVLMQPRNVRLYLNKMLDVNNQFLERIRRIRDPDTLEMPDTFENDINHLTFESVSVVALDQQVGLFQNNKTNEDAEKLFLCLRNVLRLFHELDMRPSLWKIIKTPKFHELMNVMDEMHEIIMRFVNVALERIEKTPHETPDEEKSVLEKLLKVDKNIAVVMASDMLMAGVDTTSSTIVGILLCIAKNPEKQEKLRQELRTILPEKDSLLTVESLKNLPYLRACIKEGIRMYPIGNGTVRTNDQDIVISGYQVPKNQKIAIMTNLLLMDEKHVPRANEYIPERWLREEKENLTPSNPFLYTPFGFGPRSCVGKRLVELELDVTIARLVRNFYIDFQYSTENAFKNVLVNIPAIPLKFRMSEVEN